MIEDDCVAELLKRILEELQKQTTLLENPPIFPNPLPHVTRDSIKDKPTITWECGIFGRSNMDSWEREGNNL